MPKSLVSMNEPEPGAGAVEATAAAPASPPARGATTGTYRKRRLAAAILKEKSKALFRHFPAALGGDEESIHQLRVSGRRLRIALRLLADKPDGRRACRAQRLLRQLTQTAGIGRDLDVLFETFAGRLGGLPRRTAEQGRLRHRLADARRRGRARMVERLLDVDIARLRADLRDLAARGGPEPAAIAERIRDFVGQESRALLEGLATLGALLDVRALHALRRRARRLRYAIEVFGQIFGAQAGATKPWKLLQDRIGVLHDHDVLAEWFDRQALADGKRGESGLAAAAAAEATWARQTMHSLHDHLLADDPSALVRHGLSAVGFAAEMPSW